MKKIFLTVLVCILIVLLKNTHETNTTNMLRCVETNSVYLPKNIYGEWIITEYINWSLVGRDSNENYINDTLEIQRDYISYNNAKMTIENIEVVYDSMSFLEWESLHYYPWEFMDEDDVASYYIVELKSTLDNQITHIGIVFTGKGGVYITTSYVCLLGKATRCD